MVPALEDTITESGEGAARAPIYMTVQGGYKNIIIERTGLGNLVFIPLHAGSSHHTHPL